MSAWFPPSEPHFYVTQLVMLNGQLMIVEAIRREGKQSLYLVAPYPVKGLGKWVTFQELVPA